jgi:aspartate/glutamate racemase
MSNREEIVATLQQMSQPDPMQQQMQQLQMATAQATLQKTQAEAAKAAAEAQKAGAQAQAIPTETQIKAVTAMNSNKPVSPLGDIAKIASVAVKEADIKSNERIAMLQMAGK